MLEVTSGLFLGVMINGMNYPIESNGFQSLVIVSNRRMSVTTCELSFTDVTKQINSDITVADGVELLLKVGKSVSEYTEYKFRIWNPKRQPAGSIQAYTLYGYMDSPKWFIDSWKFPIEGTSSEVLKKLAAGCGLPFSGDPTNDSMVWLPGNQRTCMFAKHIAEHGYLDGFGCMSLGMTCTGEIRYRNLNTLPEQGEFTFTQGGVNGTINVIDHKYLFNSGFANLAGGYQQVRQPQGLFSDTPIDQLSVKRKTQMLQMNKDVKSMIDRGRIDFAPLDAGNVHANWDRAAYQNKRGALLYTTGLELLTNERTPLNLDVFSTLMWEGYDPPGAGSVSLSEQYRGVYVVTAKAITLTPGKYFEKIQAFAPGINKDPDMKGSQL